MKRHVPTRRHSVVTYNIPANFQPKLPPWVAEG
jgi:hypothetical protein